MIRLYPDYDGGSKPDGPQSKCMIPGAPRDNRDMEELVDNPSAPVSLLFRSVVNLSLHNYSYAVKRESSRRKYEEPQRTAGYAGRCLAYIAILRDT